MAKEIADVLIPDAMLAVTGRMTVSPTAQVAALKFPTVAVTF
jgi:hypothetical protein